MFKSVETLEQRWMRCNTKTKNGRYRTILYPCKISERKSMRCNCAASYQ